jgi:hypothetical protein
MNLHFARHRILLSLALAVLLSATTRVMAEAASHPVETPIPAAMGSEDFQEAFKSLDTPYAFMLVGVTPPEQFAKARGWIDIESNTI